MSQDQQADDRQYLTVAEVARRCSVSETTVREAIWRLELPATRWGRRVLVAVEDLERYLRTRSSRMRPEPVVLRRDSGERTV